MIQCVSKNHKLHEALFINCVYVSETLLKYPKFRWFWYLENIHGTIQEANCCDRNKKKTLWWEIIRRWWELGWTVIDEALLMGALYNSDGYRVYTEKWHVPYAICQFIFHAIKYYRTNLRKFLGIEWRLNTDKNFQKVFESHRGGNEIYTWVKQQRRPLKTIRVKHCMA